MPFFSDGSDALIANGITISEKSSVVLDYTKVAAVASVGSGTPATTISSYTAGATDVSITKILMSGGDNATWWLEVDSVVIAEFGISNNGRTRDLDFDSPFTLAAGSTLDVKMKHFFTGKTYDFRSTIFGNL